MGQAIAALPRLKELIVSGEDVRIPGWVVDFTSFRRWTLHRDFPESGRIDYVDEQVWVDMTIEEF